MIAPPEEHTKALRPDAIAYAEGAAALCAAVALATWIPTRRALRVDPATTLRCD